MIEGSAIPYTLIPCNSSSSSSFVRSRTCLPVGRTSAFAVGQTQPITAQDIPERDYQRGARRTGKSSGRSYGPQTFSFDKAVRKVLEYDHDPREVIGDSSSAISMGRGLESP